MGIKIKDLYRLHSWVVATSYIFNEMDIDTAQFVVRDLSSKGIRTETVALGIDK